LTDHPRALADEWTQLCKWFRDKASEAISKSKSERESEIILFTIAAFCRDEPPKTVEGLTAFRSFAERQVDLWQTSPLPQSDSDLTQIKTP